MKQKKILILFAVIGLVALASLYFFNSKEDGKSKVSFNTERVLKKIEKLDESINLNFTPSYMTVKDDTLSLLNYDTQQISFVDKDNKIANSIGKGRGEGPNEYNRIYHYDYDDEYLYAFDVSKYSIAKTKKSTNDLVNYYLDSLRINHAQRIYDGKFLITYRDNKTNINFGILDINDRKVASLGNVNSSFEKIQDSWWIFDGVFDKADKDNSIFYVTYFSDDLVKIDADGNLAYKTKLIHETPLIKLTKQGDMLFPSENSSESTLDTAVDDEYVYVLSNVSDRTNPENKGKRVVDCYKISTGVYAHSYVLPNLSEETLPLEIEVLDNKLYTMYEESIESYQLTQTNL